MSAYQDEIIIITFNQDRVEDIHISNIALTNKRKIEQIKIFPAKHYIINEEIVKRVVKSIKSELKLRLLELNEIEKERLET